MVPNVLINYSTAGGFKVLSLLEFGLLVTKYAEYFQPIVDL